MHVALKRLLYAFPILLLALSGCKKTADVPETGEVVTIQMSLETGFPQKDEIKSVVIVLDAKDPTAQVVFNGGQPQTGTISGLPVRWEYTDYDNDQGLEQVITVSGNPFAASTFFMVHILPKVTVAIPMKVSVIAKDLAGQEIGWGFGCDNQGQEIYLGIRQIVGVAVKGVRNDPCPPCRYQGCDAFGNCPFDFNCQEECCECREPCSPDGGVCNGDKSCVNGCCISGGKAVGDSCSGASECASGHCVDGNCCNTECSTACHACAGGTCQAVKGADDDPGCTGEKTCDADGLCRKKNGQACTGGEACASGHCKDGKCCDTECTAVCHTCATGACTVQESGEDYPECAGASTCAAGGVCKPKPGQACTDGSACASGFCKDGVCCDEACDGACRSCLTGTCQAVKSGDDGPECVGDKTCDATGACLLKNGRTCSDGNQCASGHCADGKCCDAACQGVCKSCVTGSCTTVIGADDAPQCSGDSTCDAAGACKKRNGQGCTGNVECASGHCKDGKCCNTECTALCHSCATGTCISVNGQDDQPECTGASTCDATGACKPKPGQACTNGAQCASGFCKDGVCCGEACDGECKSCLTGTCRSVSSADDPDTCTGEKTCSADGKCRKKNGRACDGATECASGFCADGKCCDTACTTACRSCATGACLKVTGAEDADSCKDEWICSADGECRKKAGQECILAGECLSGFCEGGRCCDRACPALCHSCDTGTCLQVLSGGEDEPDCKGDNACDALGQCKKKNGQPCTGGVQCASGICKDGTCCDTECVTACHSCATGTCTPVKGADDYPECIERYTCSMGGACLLRQGQACTGSSECATGYCVDGKCCDTECTTTCRSCATGTCSLLTDADDPPACTGTQTCGAGGVCLLKNGQGCNSGTACSSGHCTDGKCCDQGCTEPCWNCATGTCVQVKGADDLSQCEGIFTCSDNGLCLFKNGQNCSALGACASGHCKDGRCCDTSCSLPCYSCATGTCAKVSANTADPPECVGLYACSQDGVCLLDYGQSCSGASQCASGYCADGRCCDTACSAICYSCQSGACAQLDLGAEDYPACYGERACSADGACKLKNGQECTEGTACASGFCVDGKCCDTACDTNCYDCATGTCLPMTYGEQDYPGCMEYNVCRGALCLPRYPKLSAKFMQTCAIMENGTLACWGYNLVGQLGLK